MKKNTDESRIDQPYDQLVHDSTREYVGLMDLLQKFKTTSDVQQASENNDMDIVNAMENLVILNNSYLKQGLEQLDRTNRFKMENSQFRAVNLDLQTRCETLDTELRRCEAYCEDLKSAKSFRISRVFVDAIKKPGKNTLLIPYSIIKILISK